MCSFERLQRLKVNFQRIMLLTGKRQKFEAVLVSATVTGHCPHFPRNHRSGKRKTQTDHLAAIHLCREEYPHPSFGQIPAMPFKLLIVISEIAHGYSKIATISDVPPPATVDLSSDGLSCWGGH